jgi:peptidoglycan-N-acetylglucosamine deacetylase
VLHDVVDACLERLPELLDRLVQLGAVWRQVFPEDVVMIRGGRSVNLPGSYIADPTA